MNESSILTHPDESVRPGAGLPAGRPWQRALREAVRDPRELCRLLKLPPEHEAAAVRAAGAFGLFAPRGYVARMRVGDPHDPLLRQVLPLGEELVEAPGFAADPVGDAAATLHAGLLQKYQGRALMVTTGACAVHCRYCFRRHYPYSEGPHSLAEWEPALERLAADASIDEVLLSGGDPLTLVDPWLARLAERLAQIGHLRRLRVHTRLPIVIPERVCDELLAWLRGTRLTPIVVVHANHPAEISPAVAAALGRLVDAGIPVLNQAVLLRGVNDDVDALAELCRRLVDLRVMPYYLHQLDRVEGAAHFEVAEETGRRLIAELRRRLPGYAVPRYVRETAGELGKSVLA
ncbi:MAG TPA: EF-P beta-lysylation protein EpmB [Pirellulales bacterium]|jgi:EF-P beta-lysylation protein EpmB|nr:EF-P beta-lysylation protein EpmB [Pirellulales bacterium]